MAPPQFIGKTGLIGQVLQSKIPRIKNCFVTNPIERRWLFTGPAGVGKTELAMLLASEIAGHPLNVEKRMGSQISVEVVRDWVRNIPYRPLIGDMNVKFADEVETIPSAAVVELRGYLDELPPSVVFIATTNKPVKELQEPLQTRFQVWKFEPVQASAIAELLIQRFPMLPEEVLRSIASKVSGNVRAALTDAASELDVLNFRNRQDACVAT
jgi:DNA polymerase III delta prime subunit